MDFSGQHFKLGILGGGQLGRMLLQEAINLNISTSVMDPDSNAPCRHLTETFIHADFRNESSVYDFGKTVQLLTVEIEHVNIQALLRLQSEGLIIYPQPEILRMVQDKGLQKEFYIANNIPTAGFRLIKNKKELAAADINFPCVLKLRTSGYDGKGVMKLKEKFDIEKAFDAPCVLEEMIDFEKEIAVIVARNIHGEIKHFPPVEMEFNPDVNLVEFLCSPARIENHIAAEAVKIAEKIIENCAMVGILAVEMFVTNDGKILVNEIAPRPHNSGHQTIEGNSCSQYAQHLRAILGLPLGDTSIIKPAVMINLLGAEGFSGEASYKGLEEIMRIPEVYIHLYGKKITKPFRKMGHITVTDSRIEDAIAKARKVQGMIRVVSKN